MTMWVLSTTKSEHTSYGSTTFSRHVIVGAEGGRLSKWYLKDDEAWQKLTDRARTEVDVEISIVGELRLQDLSLEARCGELRFRATLDEGDWYGLRECLRAEGGAS